MTAPKPPLRPDALTLADAARLLAAAGGEAITEEMLRADVVAGAPINGDRTMNLLQYTAWLAQQHSSSAA